MDTFDSAALYSSIDHQCRYAYRNQPAIAHWNLSCLAQTLLPLFNADEDKAVEIAQNSLNEFPDLYQKEYRAVFSSKLGLTTLQADDETLIQDFLDLLQNNRSDFTLAFRRLGELPIDGNEIKSLFNFPDSFVDWISRWQSRCSQESISAEARHQQIMSTNPAFIPRNHLVEEAIQPAYSGDFSLFHRLNRRLAKPFEYDAADQILATPPKPEQIVQQTFCGT